NKKNVKVLFGDYVGDKRKSEFARRSYECRAIGIFTSGGDSRVMNASVRFSIYCGCGMYSFTNDTAVSLMAEIASKRSFG
ncbi:hypothetical protein B4U79_01081, partial [Dinothrombium tinctorium]